MVHICETRVFEHLRKHPNLLTVLQRVSKELRDKIVSESILNYEATLVMHGDVLLAKATALYGDGSLAWCADWAVTERGLELYVPEAPSADKMFVNIHQCSPINTAAAGQKQTPQEYEKGL